MAIGRAGLVGLVVACGGNNAARPVVADDARGSASVAHDGGSGSAATPTGVGELDVTVLWKDTPLAARASPGRSTCGAPRLASVAPTTTWGIPEVVVVVDGVAAKLAEARISVADCAITPRVAVGDHLVVTSTATAPIQLGIASYGLEPEAVDGKAVDGKPTPVPVLLPVAGHEVTRTLDAGIYQLAAGGETAWVVAKANAIVTDAAGQAVFRDVPAGPHNVVAWLPARGDQPAKLVTAKATVTPGAPLELAIDLGP